ncbi:hypothetical protein AB0C21_11075 [Spirillospora sp. NPDC049024]
MERITEDQIARLVAFVEARIADADSPQEEMRRMVAALRLVVHRQVGAVGYFRAAHTDSVAAAEIAIGSWNLLVYIACIWRDHSEFPVDAAIETYEFVAENPLMPPP